MSLAAKLREGEGLGKELGPPISLSTHIMEKKDLSSLSLSREAGRASPSSGVRDLMIWL